MNRPGLVVADVSVRFRGLHALSHVSFAVEPGELTALIGPNGAGKSTLINVICGAQPPSGGAVRFAGRPIAGRKTHVLARAGLVRTFQGLELFGALSVADNVVAGGLGRVRFWGSLLRVREFDRTARRLRAQALQALELVGLLHRAAAPAGTLPAGERRLLAIARALATGADWLVLDEPGAGLNEIEKTRLADTIAGLHGRGKTILFVEHDMALVGRLARRILVLDRGELIADGTPQAVRADERVLSAYLGVRPTTARGENQSRTRPAPVLQAKRLSVAYGGVQALRAVSLQLGPGELVAVVGANGAGKSTLLKALAGVLTPQAGDVLLDGAALSRRETRNCALVRRGVALVPEGRELFVSLTVEENLLLGHWSQAGRLEHWLPMRVVAKAPARSTLLAETYALFPRLRERRHQLAGSLSGGEGQMLAIGRALMSRPRLLLLDEPSLGLAPLVIEEILDMLAGLTRRGLGVLLVEQNARAALMLADHGYVLENGRVKAEGAGSALLDSGRVADAYLGGAERRVAAGAG